MGRRPGEEQNQQGVPWRSSRSWRGHALQTVLPGRMSELLPQTELSKAGSRGRTWVPEASLCQSAQAEGLSLQRLVANDHLKALTWQEGLFPK